MNRRLIVNGFTRYRMNAQPTNAQSLPPGTRIEEFVIERVLGSGGVEVGKASKISGGVILLGAMWGVTFW